MEENPSTPSSVINVTKRRAATNASLNIAKKQASNLKRVSSLLRKKKNRRPLSEEEEKFLLSNSELVKQFYKRREKRAEWLLRQNELEDSPSELEEKCFKLAQAIHDAEFLVVYTGAGISTAASIPDYRGPNGIWTRLQKGKDIGNHDLTAAEPTYTHMALAHLHSKGIVRHVVSQNCDGLHLRSGLPKTSISEVHGNMYIEVCKKCVPAREYVRTFDVTENTSTFKHTTGRRCYRCGEPLVDTIVHFGERGHLRWPLNWQGACQAAKACDTILCLGSSLKVLRKYTWLWQMNRTPKRRPRLYVVNLQWTPKDKDASLKINGKCDDVMKLIMKNLGLEVSPYFKSEDPIFNISTPLHMDELGTISRPPIEPPTLSSLPYPNLDAKLNSLTEAFVRNLSCKNGGSRNSTLSALNKNYLLTVLSRLDFLKKEYLKDDLGGKLLDKLKAQMQRLEDTKEDLKPVINEVKLEEKIGVAEDVKDEDVKVGIDEFGKLLDGMKDGIIKGDNVEASHYDVKDEELKEEKDVIFSTVKNEVTGNGEKGSSKLPEEKISDAEPKKSCVKEEEEEVKVEIIPKEEDDELVSDLKTGTTCEDLREAILPDMVDEPKEEIEETENGSSSNECCISGNIDEVSNLERNRNLPADGVLIQNEVPSGTEMNIMNGGHKQEEQREEVISELNKSESLVSIADDQDDELSSISTEPNSTPVLSVPPLKSAPDNGYNINELNFYGTGLCIRSTSCPLDQVSNDEEDYDNLSLSSVNSDQKLETSSLDKSGSFLTNREYLTTSEDSSDSKLDKDQRNDSLERVDGTANSLVCSTAVRLSECLSNIIHCNVNESEAMKGVLSHGFSLDGTSEFSEEISVYDCSSSGGGQPETIFSSEVLDSSDLNVEMPLNVLFSDSKYVKCKIDGSYLLHTKVIDGVIHAADVQAFGDYSTTENSSNGILSLSSRTPSYDSQIDLNSLRYEGFYDGLTPKRGRRGRRRKLKRRPLELDDDVKRLWFWGCDTQLKEKAPQRRITRGSYQKVLSNPESASPGYGCNCLVENPTLCRLAAGRHGSLPPEEEMVKAREAVYNKRQYNYRKFEPVFEVSLKSLTYKRRKIRRSRRRETEVESVGEDEDDERKDGHFEDEEDEASKQQHQQQLQEDNNKIVPGWYGKGYRKLLKKKKTTNS